MHQSILALKINPRTPLGNRGAFADVVSPGGGAFAILSPGLGICTLLGDPGNLTRVVSKSCVYVMEAFIHVGQDMNYVADWLVHQRYRETRF